MTTRRNYLRGFGIATGAATISGLGVYFSTDKVSAESVSNMDITAPPSVTTDDGAVEYVAFSGSLSYEWEGAEEVASYGRAKLSGSLFDGRPSRTDSRELITKDWNEEIFQLGIEEVRRYGTVGEQSPDSPTNTGKFIFSSTGQLSGEYDTPDMPVPICVVAASSELQSAANASGFVSPSSSYTDPSTDADGNAVTNTTGGYVLVDDLFNLGRINSPNDRETREVYVQLEFTGQVFQSDPADSSAAPAAPPATVKGSFPVRVTNRGAAVSAHGTGQGIVGGNQT